MKRKSKIRAGWLRFFVLSFIFVFCSSMPAVAQNGIKITGKIVDNTQMEVIGANVLVKGTSIGAITDINGEYTIVVPDEKAILVFSFIGYQKQEIAVGKNRTVNVTLKDDSQSLDEVVVVAYGTQTKATLTGALSSIDTKELLKAPVASISNVLAGAMPGVSTVQTSGQPGDDAASIFVRGSGSLTGGASSPLILVDGVEREFSQIDPNEIENLSILKDASATAVFGVRGANGVVLVTTRRGKSGKPTINVSTITGVQQPLSYVQQTGSYEFARYWNMKQQNDRVTDKAMYFTREAIEAYRTGSDPIMYPNTKWGDYMYNDLFIQSKNNINISGGNEAVKYFVSLSYLYQNGILKQFDALPYDNNFKYNRYNYRANLDFKLTRTTTMKLNIGGNVGQKQEPRASSDNPWVYTQIWALPFAGPGIVNGVRTMTPGALTPVGVSRDGLSIYWGQGYNQEYKTTLNTDVDITQKLDILTKGLSVSVKASYDNMFRLNKYRTGGTVESQTAYYKSFMDDSTKPQTDPDYDKTIVYVPNGSITPLNYSEDYGRDRNWYIEGRINYDRTFNKDHKVTALFLYNQSRNYYPKKSDGTDATYQYMPRGYVGFVGRATYGYKSKYLIDVNAGYNGSENFAPGKNRYGLFPSASVGWIMSEEAFMKKQSLIDYLKWRISWGRVGSDTGSSTRFMYMPGVWTQNGTYSFGVSNPTGSQAYILGTPGNTDVSWETADKQNYGIDLKMLNNRLSLSVDYFKEKRTGILISPNSTPSIIATGLPNLNIGKVDNHGYEISLGWDHTLNNGIHYYANANMSFARNKIIYMDEVPNKYDYMNQTSGSTERPTNVYKYLRLYQYSDFTKDANGELVLNPSLPQPSVKVYPGDAMYADLNASLIYDQQSYTANGRNKGAKRQSGILYATYMYNDRYTINGVLNYSGTAFLPEGDHFHLYPAISAAWIASNEKFMKSVEAINLFKLYASYGISGWDGNMQHELYRQSYGSANGGTYYFTNNASEFYGLAEGNLPVENLTIEKSKKVTYGMELNAFKNRLSVYLEGFYERRSNILINGSPSVSNIIGIGVSKLNAGIQDYKGFDASVSWNDKIGKDFNYSIGANASYVNSKIINDGQEYQQYDYLYTKGNRVGQRYGLEAIGFFHDQVEINNSPVQTFSTVRPGDIKYKDQNGDNRIDEQDVVKMFGSSVPRFYFGVNLTASYKNFEISADFQGMTGVTTSLLNSPLYQPLVNNGNISQTFLNNETPWTPENASQATMPRLTTLTNANNYRANSLWYRDGSFIKLRNLYASYTFPKKMIRFADMKVYLQGSNLFSLDNIGFADPEQLGAIYPSTRSYWAGIKFNF